jgi:hypothetical protein
MSNYSIPQEALRQHIAILGKTGAGKSATARLCVEQVVAEGYRVCILDTIKSDWWGITSSADGKKPGLPFKILGGPRGHVGLHSSAGKAIGQLVAEGKLPHSIIDMADFEPGGVQKFFSDFAPALMRHAKGVLYLVIEEAHEVAMKERSGIGNENLSIHWAKKIATAGRSKGIRLIVATQRIQSLHNAVLGSCETLIAHRLSAPADQAPIKTWLKSNADKATAAKVEQSLSSLPTGTAWLCSGEARIFEKIAFPKFATYDNAKTPTGDDEIREIKTAPVDQDELRAIIGDAVAEAEANDPKRLKAKVAELTKQLAGKAPIAKAQPDEEALRAAEARGKVAGFEDGRRVGYAEGEKAALSRAAAALAGVTAGDATLTALPARPAVRLNVSEPARVAQPAPRGVAPRSSGASLPQGEQACLAIIAQHHNGVRRQQLTIITGYKRATRDAYILRLKNRGLVEQNGERIVATDAGIAALGPAFDPLPTGDALRDHVLSRLPEGERKVLEILISNYPQSVQRDEIDNATGFKRATRDAYLLRLRARELVDQVGREVKASDDLFSEAA